MKNTERIVPAWLAVIVVIILLALASCQKEWVPPKSHSTFAYGGKYDRPIQPITGPKKAINCPLFLMVVFCKLWHDCKNDIA